VAEWALPTADRNQFVRTYSTSATGASAIYEGPAGDRIIEPFDGRHDKIDIWRDDLVGVVTVCKCPRGATRPRVQSAEAVRSAVKRAVANDDPFV
jgi:hypothetical protein